MEAPAAPPNSGHQQLSLLVILLFEDPEPQFWQRDGQDDDEIIPLGLHCKRASESQSHTNVRKVILPFKLFLPFFPQVCQFLVSSPGIFTIQ